MAFAKKNLEVKTSTLPNAGKGLFTKVFIEKGTRITEYEGRYTNWEDVAEDADNGYIFYIDDDNVIDAGKMKNSKARYANDAAGLTRIKGVRNNTKYVNENNRIFIDATRDIQAGEEIFVGYGKEYWETVRNNIRLDKEEAMKKQKKVSKKK